MRAGLGRSLIAAGLLAALGAGAASASAATFLLPDNGDAVLGDVQLVTARHEDTLLDIARRHDVGYEEMILANPGVDPWLPGEGTLVVVPTSFVLPDAPREGIVLNVAEMRLYYFPKPRAGEPARVITHPVSIGRLDWKTPLGRTRITNKVVDPAWYPPESIREEHAALGDPLPKVVPPGPDNPLGRHALRLAIPGYLIHGTNKPYGIGMRVTHGCVRMYPEDIETLFDQVPVGTVVHIVNQPFKAGWRSGTLFVETHPPYVPETAGGEAADNAPPPAEPPPAEPINLTESVRRIVSATSTSAETRAVDWDLVMAAAETRSGIPTAVSIGGIELGAQSATRGLALRVSPRVDARLH